MEVLLLVPAGILGACIGSFLGAVSSRVPDHRSLLPRSACPSCGTALGARDLIPVVSWLALRGRCRACHTTISWRYPAVETVTAATWVALVARYGLAGYLPAALIGASGLICLAVVDIERHLLPTRIVYVTLAGVTASLTVDTAITGTWGRLESAALIGAICEAVFWALWLARPGGIGFGDVRLAGLIGVLIGWSGALPTVLAFLAASAAGTVLAVTAMAVGKATKGTRWPLGVFLAAGAIIALLAGGVFTRIALPTG